MNRICLFLYFLFFIPAIGLAQGFSNTYNELPITSENGWGITISAEGEIYCTSALVCQDLTVACINVYNFNSSGELLWSKLIEDKRAVNWENIILENDSLFIGVNRLQNNDTDYCEQIILDPISGDQINNFQSYYYPNGISLGGFGQFFYEDEIYMYGTGFTHLPDDNDGPGYIHRMDKRGNYVSHLEYRPDNFSGIYQLMENPVGQLIFLCNSTSDLTDVEDYSLVNYDPNSGQTSIVYEIGYQRADRVAPFFVKLSDKYVITEIHYDDNEVSEIIDLDFSIRGVSFNGDSLWQFSYWEPFWGSIGRFEFMEMTSCANDDFLLSGQYRDEDGNLVGFIMRFSTDGELVWERRYYTYDNAGKVKNSHLSAVREMPDGSIVGIGAMQQQGGFDVEEDFWILKVGADGCYREDDCEDVSINQWLTETEEVMDDSSLVLYPNPADDYLTIESQELIISTEIYGLDGKLISRKKHSDNTLQVSLDHLKVGMYSIKVMTPQSEEVLLFVKL